jgi:ADP-heptose:LPS heptosyltransferase/GT2 family glycosyltransferase
MKPATATARRRGSARTRPPVKARPLIGIRLDAEMPAIRFRNRHDVAVRGAVVTASCLESIALIADGETIGLAQFGQQPELPSARGDGAAHQGFAFTLSLPLAAEPRTVPCAVRVRARDGAEAETAFVLHLDPRRLTAVVTGDEAVSSAPPGGVPASIVMAAERAVLDAEGHLRVSGWAISLDRLVAVQIFAGEERVGSARLGAPRDDVALAWSEYPNARRSGFSLISRRPVAQTEVAIRAQAITKDGATLELRLPVERPAGPQTETEPAAGSPAQEVVRDRRRAIDLFCDELVLETDGVLHVGGWAVSPTGIARIAVLVDGTRAGNADLGLIRQDVAEAYPDIPAARFSGFRLDASPLGGAVGEHVVTIIARNGLGDERQHSITVTASAPTPASAADPRPPVPVARVAADADAFRFHLDSPALIGDAAAQPVTGRLTIEGWALAREGMAGIEVLLDDQLLGSAHYGLARHDVGKAFPDWPDAVRGGYAFHCPARSLPDGEHTVTLRMKARHGATLLQSFRVTIDKSADASPHSGVRRRIPVAEAELYEDTLRRLGWRPRFRLLLHPGAAEAISATLASLRAQVYPEWRVDLLDDSPALREAVLIAVQGHGIDAARVGFLSADEASGGFTENDDEAAETFVGALAAGDVLGCDALAEFAVQSGLRRDAELLYADEIRVPPAGGEPEAWFKPQFSPDLLLSTNYIGRPWFATPRLLARTGMSPTSLAELGEYDLLLRCTEQTESTRIVALPRLLCECASDGGPAGSTDVRATEALVAAAERRGIAAEIEPGCLPGILRFRRDVQTAGKVSIIVPTCAAQDFVRTCLETLRTRTAYRNIEVIAIDNIPAALGGTKAWLHENADKVVEIQEPFNWSRFNNRAAEAADGEFLLFLNDDIEIIQDSWLDAMLEHAQRPEVGVVGAQLLYPDGKVQHAGMFLAGLGLARHAFRFAAADEPGYFGLARTQRNVIAVTGACLLTRRAVFDALGGFDEAHEVINNDLDFCLRAHAAGLLTVYTPHATLIHHELASRAMMRDVYDLTQFGRRWRMRFGEGDPFHNANLSRQHDDYRPNEEPARAVFSGHPLFRAKDIRAILVVKVDHIGDFVTALPAIRRLKSHFPDARISVLASRAAQEFAALDPAIDEIIAFDFFHARSALGRREMGPEELAALSERLAPYRFDLAIDLRKHPETRELLRCASAAFTAGFDQMGRFDWLDITLQWEGDRGLSSKQYHITDDLLHLVDAVGTAAMPDRTGILPGALVALGERTELPAALAAFLAASPGDGPGEGPGDGPGDGPVICVHAGAGNEMKQWPADFFATLIDMLIVRAGARVLLLGGPDEAALEQEILAAVENRDRIMSVVGQLPLAALPVAMAGCAMYVGNDSGPKHIAAAVGIPTVGVHSGTVDPVEWAPVGPRAVAVARAMACSPCYLNRLSDCPRELACLRQLEPQAVFRICEAVLARPAEGPSTAPVGKPTATAEQG